MNKQRLAIDMDDVMAFTVKQIVDRYENEFGYRLTDADLAGKLVEDAVPVEHRQVVLDWIFAPGFYRNLPIMDEAQSVVYDLNKHYDVFVVSAANLIPSSVPEKLEWLDKHFKFIDVRNTVFCGHKYIINADYMIDDHVKNLTGFAGKGILFDAHHNVYQNAPELGFKRTQGWGQVANLLLA
jgi:5'-nucleotidase